LKQASYRLSLTYKLTDSSWLQALDEPRVPYAPLLGQIIPTIFSRWAFYFPTLDIPGRYFLSRKATLDNIAKFDSLLNEIVESTLNADAEKQPKVVSHMLKRALDNGQLTPELYRYNLRMSFMFGHDTTAIFMGLTMYVLGNNTVRIVLPAPSLLFRAADTIIHPIF
jgi:unspecific monooxygenase